MGNNSGKEKTQTPEGTIPPIPEIQQAEEKAKKAAEQLRNSPQVQKLEDKARQTAENLKQSAAVQEGEKKLKEVADAAHKNQTLQKVEETGKAFVDKAKQTVSSIDVHKIEDKAKEAVEKAKNSVESIQDFKQTLNTFSKESTAYFNEAQNTACKYYGIAKDEVSFVNREAPIAIAAFKRDYVFPIDTRFRAVGHYGLTALTFLISLKARAGIFSSVRNTAFVGLTSGFLLYPESINPFRRENFPPQARGDDYL